MIARCMSVLFFTYFDLVSDLNLARVLLIKAKRVMEGGVTLGIVVLSIVIQGLFTFFTKTGMTRYVDTLLAMLCVKPMVDVFRVTSGADRHTDSLLDPTAELGITRGLEITFESMPQGVFQTFLILQDPFSTTITVQLVTLSSSCLAVGFCMANVEYDLDISSHFRRIEPLLYGRYPEAKGQRAWMFACTSLMISFTFVSRCFALASLALQSPWIFVAWFVLEIVVFLVIKYQLGMYKYFQADSMLVGTICSIGCLICCQVAPFTFLSLPFFLGPRLYRWGTGWFAVSSWLMFAVASTLSNSASSSSSTPTPTMTTGLSPSMGALVLGLLHILAGLCFMGAWKAMNPVFHERILASKYTIAMHFQSYIWNTYVYEDYGPSMDDHRASVLTVFIVEYWWREGVMEWLDENWEAWLSQVENGTAPPWFDRRWRSKIPLDMLPETFQSREAAYRETVTVVTTKP